MIRIIPPTVSALCGLGHLIRWAVVLVLAGSVVPSPAAAQPPAPAPGGIGSPSRPERPYRGLFGGGVGDTTQSLTLDGSLGVGTGAPPSVAAGTGPTSVFEGSGNLTGSGTLSYTLGRDKYTVYATNTFLGDYFRQPSGNRLLPREILTAGVSLSPSSSTGVAIGLTYKNVPDVMASDFFDGDLDEVIPLNQNVGLTFERYNRIGTTFDVSQRLTQRIQIAGGLSYARGMTKTKAWTILLYTGSVSYNISKGLGVYVEYKDGGQRDETLGQPHVTDRHPRTSFGVDYRKPLSLSRRTTLSYSTGTAGVYDRKLDAYKYELIGSVNLDREIGRTWLASVGYSRDVRYIEFVGEPLLGNYVTAGLEGSFSRRVQFETNFGGSSGYLGLNKEDITKTDMYFGAVKLSVALTRMLSLTTDYGYYTYTLPSHELLDVRAGPGRYQVFRAYLQVWLPLITQRKR
jgi:hypothetical protein